MLCQKCGGVLDENALFCRFCGNKIEQEVTIVETKEVSEIGLKPGFIVNSGTDKSTDDVEHSLSNSIDEDVSIDEDISVDADNADGVVKENKSKNKYVLIAIAIVALIVIIGIVSMGSFPKEDYLGYDPYYDTYYDDVGAGETPTNDSDYIAEDQTDDTYYNINTAYMTLVNNLYTEGDVYYDYMIYDMDQDGVTELIYMKGTCRADLQIICYTFDGEKLHKLGSVSGDEVYRTEENRGIYTYYAQMGGETLRLVTKVNNGIIVDTIFSREVEEYSPPSDEYLIEKFKYNNYTGINQYARYADEYIPVPDETVKEMLVIADGGLRLRDNPDVEHGEVIGLIPDGTRVTVEKTVGEWAYTTYDGVSGWCSCEFLFDNSNYEGTPLYNAVVNSYDGLKLRSKADASVENTIMVIPYRAQVQVYEVNGTWAYISYNGILGWCYTEFLNY